MSADNNRPQASPPNPLWVTGAMVGAVIGAFVVLALGKSQWVTTNITYTDLAAVMLATVTILITLFAIIMAVAAVYGYRELQQMIERRADEAAAKYMDTVGLRTIEARADSATASYLESKGDEVLKRREDEILSGRDGDDDELDEQDREFIDAREAARPSGEDE
ncbi:hypothetical protein TPR58_17875 [Sphingomonas sp. HF-S3]|uniref:Uncharacterized protein n=1 Tax=Sphingomonas rustica TaxID=3103142 RepID=A0ABV0BCS4_9SPHN